MYFTFFRQLFRIIAIFDTTVNNFQIRLRSTWYMEYVFMIKWNDILSSTMNMDTMQNKHQHSLNNGK